VSGLIFGVLALVLMITRIQLADGVYIDARAVPVALIALFEGWPAAILAGVIPAVYRLTLYGGGGGAAAGVAGVLAAAAAGALAHAWARRDGGVRARHSFTLSGGVFVTTYVSFLFVGPYGADLIGRVWAPLLITYVVGIGVTARLLQDIVEQARLRAEQERFHAIIDEASDAVRIVDADTHRILDCNRGDCELSGFARHEMIGRDARDFWPTEPAPRAEHEAARAEAEAQGFARTFGLPFRTRTGATIRIDLTRRLVPHNGRRYEIIIFHDAQAREAAEAAEREAAELRGVTQLANAAAHEINNPLAIVMGSLDLLGRRLPEEAQEARWVNQALGAVRRVRDIVVRMNQITRIERVPGEGNLPPILDIRKSSDVEEGREAS
jgi:PAS domain S-box-containing protein